MPKVKRGKRKNKSTANLPQLGVRDILHVYRAIINEAIARYGKRKLMRIDLTGTTDTRKRKGIPLYTLITTDGTEKISATPPAFLVNQYGDAEAKRLYSAYKAFSLCDLSILCTFQPVKAKLGELGVQVEWIYVKPGMTFALKLEDEEEDVDPTDTDHSVLRLTDAEGNIAIVDWTMDQHGMDSAPNWYKNKLTYFNQFADSHGWQVCRSRYNERPPEENEAKYMDMIRKLCFDVDWDKMRGLTEAGRIREAKAVTAAACQKALREASKTVHQQDDDDAEMHDAQEDSGEDTEWHEDSEDDSGIAL